MIPIIVIKDFLVNPLIGLPLEFGNNKIDKYEAKNVLEEWFLRHTGRRCGRNNYRKLQGTSGWAVIREAHCYQ